ncbi:MAG: hypothetical protein SH818_01310 [Saprospiraceae bacterium]|nr:hypothetical protein [Saprospiraceae bacterium]
MENNRKDQKPEAENSNLKQHPGTQPRGLGNPESNQFKKPTNSGDLRKDPMNKPNQSDGRKAPGDQSTPESYNPKHQTPEHLNNQKSNMDQVTNKDSNLSGSRDPEKQNNTTPSGTDNPYTHKQQKNPVDGSVLVEDEDQHEAIISDDMESPSEEDINTDQKPNGGQVNPEITRR